MNNPLVSVVVPTFNRAHYLLQAVESVIGQGYDRLEVIVVDDGSTDGTLDVVAGFGDRVTLVRQTNRGTAAARNAGIARATGDFLAFIDDDDVWADGKTERQMQVFHDAPGTDAVYGHVEQFVCPDVDDEQRARFRHLAGRVTPATIPAAMLIKRSSFDRVGPFDETLQIGVEIDWYSRLCDAGLSVVMLPELVYRRRLHRSNVNLTRADEQPERLHVLKRIIDRRRGNAGRSDRQSG